MLCTFMITSLWLQSGFDNPAPWDRFNQLADHVKLSRLLEWNHRSLWVCRSRECVCVNRGAGARGVRDTTFHSCVHKRSYSPTRWSTHGYIWWLTEWLCRGHCNPFLSCALVPVSSCADTDLLSVRSQPISYASSLQ